MTTWTHAAPAEASILKTGLLGSLMLLLVAAVLTGTSLPIVPTDRDAFVVLTVIGWATCAAGAGPAIRALGWRHPVTIAGIALGVVALILVALVLAGTTAPLASLGRAFAGSPGSAPSADRVAFVGLALVLLGKWVLGFARLAAR